MPKVAFKTLGCRLNQAETDRIAQDLLELGFEVVAEDGSPDVVIVNTCTVTAEATNGSRRTAMRSAAANPNALLVVAGCYSVAEPDEAARIPGVGMVASNDDKETLARVIADRLGVLSAPAPLLQLGPRSGFPGADRTRVNIKVQTGCDEFCTFCIIPHTRGPLHSYPLEEMLADARAKVEQGTRELVLTGVHLGKFGWDQRRPDDALLELMEGLLGIEGLERIRLSSILSRHLTQRVVGMIAAEDRLCRFLHIPLQSGDDEVLERMNRPYRMGEYRETIQRVTEQIPEVGLSTDVIVGFPGETTDQFEATMKVVDDVGYMKLHVFRYSPRAGTPSAAWPDQIPEAEKKARSRRLIALGNEKRLEFNRRCVGRDVEVLVETCSTSGICVGHTDNFLKVTFPGSPALTDRLALVGGRGAGIDSISGELVRAVEWQDAQPRRT